MTDGQSKGVKLPKIVNKDEKRRTIALSCVPLLEEVGIKKLTVAQVAKKAGIGKGTIYEYFENKDDIIFEIINIHIENHDLEFFNKIKEAKSTKDKIACFFYFVINKSEENTKHFNGYREYLSVVLSNDNEAYLEFNSNRDCFLLDEMKNIIDEGIKNKELLPIAIKFVDSLMVFHKGLVLLRMSTKDYDAKESFEDYINNLFDLIEIK